MLAYQIVDYYCWVDVYSHYLDLGLFTYSCCINVIAIAFICKIRMLYS